MTKETQHARQMLTELRGALVAIALLSFVAIVWDDGRIWLLAVIGLTALVPIVAQADQPDPGEGEPDETFTGWIDPDGTHR